MDWVPNHRILGTLLNFHSEAFFLFAFAMTKEGWLHLKRMNSLHPAGSKKMKYGIVGYLLLNICVL